MGRETPGEGGELNSGEGGRSRVCKRDIITKLKGVSRQKANFSYSATTDKVKAKQCGTNAHVLPALP